jgi:hypothetical protein
LSCVISAKGAKMPENVNLLTALKSPCSGGFFFESLKTVNLKVVNEFKFHKEKLFPEKYNFQ